MMINIVGFNLVWFGLVTLGNSFIPVAFLLLFIHLAFISKVKNEALIIASITLVGVFTDSLLEYFGVFIFQGIDHLPLWLIVLWSCFATTICHSLKILKKSKLHQVIVGGVFAPLSYLAGYQLNMINFSQSFFITYMLLSIIWAGLFVCFFYISAYFVKIGPRYE